MKKTLLSVFVSLVVAASAHANTYFANNPADVLLTHDNPSYTGQFTLDTYNPATETLTSAEAEFTFVGLALDSFKIVMGGDTLSHGSFFGVFVFDNDLGTSAVNAWGILDSTGVLSYTLSLTANHPLGLLLTNANLTVETTSRSVPDAGATSILLGLGVIGILGAKRRFASVA